MLLDNDFFLNTEAKMEGNSLRGPGIFGEEDTFPFLKICLNKIHQFLWRKNINQITRY
jgi:hypothetical protein